MADPGVMKLGQLLAEARARLLASGLEEGGLEARLIVEHFTRTARLNAVADPERPVAEKDVDAVWTAVERRATGEPVHRILGSREFFGLSLRLSPETLEPRPDTETLVNLVLPFVRMVAKREGGCRILDLGTGTGAIALALLDQESRATAIGTDISVEALATASSNANILGMSGRFTAVKSDWFEKLDHRFHLIVSNPPYIAAKELAGLQAEVRDYDPVRALDGGEDGLNAYRMIARDAGRCLEADGRLAVEIGFGQGPAVTGLFAGYGWRSLGSARDLGGHERALIFEQ